MPAAEAQFVFRTWLSSRTPPDAVLNRIRGVDIATRRPSVDTGGHVVNGGGKCGLHGNVHVLLCTPETLRTPEVATHPKFGTAPWGFVHPQLAHFSEQGTVHAATLRLSGQHPLFDTRSTQRGCFRVLGRWETRAANFGPLHATQSGARAFRPTIDVTIWARPNRLLGKVRRGPSWSRMLKR